MYRLSALRRVFRSGEGKITDAPATTKIGRRSPTPETNLRMFAPSPSKKIPPPLCAKLRSTPPEPRSLEGSRLSRTPSPSEDNRKKSPLATGGNAVVQSDRGNSYAFAFAKPQPARALAEPMKASKPTSGGAVPFSKASTVPTLSREKRDEEDQATSSSSYSSVLISDGPDSPSPKAKYVPKKDCTHQRQKSSTATKPSRRVRPAAEGLKFYRKPALNDFKLLKVVGTGSFGRVYLAVVRPPALEASPSANGEKEVDYAVAIKKLSKAQLIKQKQVAHVISEKEILSQISHPFTVQMFGTFQDLRYLYIVMDYIEGGEFFTYLRKRKRLETDSTRFYAAQVVTIFEYLHTKMIVYRDLKPENLLMGHDGYLRLTDFGFAKVVESRTYTLCGTPEYIAPEVLSNKGHGFSVDWWTLGILVYEMLAGYPPFVSEDPMEIYKKIRAGRVLYPEHFDKAAKSLLKHLLVVDISKRAGHVRNGKSEIRQHRWLRDISYPDLLQRRVPPPYRPHVKSAVDSDNFGDYSDKVSDDLNGKIVNQEGQDMFRDW